MRETGVSLAACTPDVRRLDDAALAAKAEAVRAYRSQLPALEAQFGVMRPAVLGHEVTWALPA